MKLIFTCLLLLSFSLEAQNNCQFDYYNKKGGQYLFSTYFLSDMTTRREDTCQMIVNGKIYERRVFKNGHLIEETLNNIDGTQRARYRLNTNPKDSIISTYVSYWETGNKNLEWIFYCNKEHRRCVKEIEYHPNGKIRFLKHRAWVKVSEVSEYEKKDYPEHTVDDDGYTYLGVPIGVEETYHDNGKLASRCYHKFIPSYFSQDQSKEGPFTQYYDNGKLHEKGQYVNGKAEGKFLDYHYTGELSGEKYFKNGIAVGTWKGWHPNGKLWYIDIYDSLAVNPFLASESKNWNEKGILLKDYKVDRNGTGYEKAWYNDGKPMYTDDLTNYQRYWGVRKDWFPDGKLWKYVNRNPRADTAVLEYFVNGKMKMLSTNTFQGEVQEHHQRYWYETEVLKQDHYQKTGQGNDKTITKYFYPSGILEKYREYRTNTRAEIDYYSNSQKKRVASYYKDKIEGFYQTYDSLGNIKEDMIYRNGLRHGLCKKYDNGKLIFERMYLEGCPDPDFTTITEPKRRNLRDVSPGLRDTIYATVIDMYQRMLQVDPKGEVFRKQQIDSTCQQVLYFYDEWNENNPKLDFPFTRNIRKIPVSKFMLPMAEYKGIENGDYSIPMSMKLKAVFDSLGWQFPKDWKLEGGKYIGTWQDGNIYSFNMMYRTFYYWYSYGFMQYEFGWMTEIDYGLKNRPYYSIQLGVNQQLRTNCVEVFSVNGHTMHGAYPSFCVYVDGSVEIYNRLSDWEDLEQAEMIPDMFRD